MIEINLLDFIPAELKEQARDALVDFVSAQANQHLGEEMGARLKKLHSDAPFNQKFEAGLQQAVRRFVAEYEKQDEDLVAAIAADPGFFRNPAIQQALLSMLKRPGAYLAEEQESLVQSFESVLPERKNRQRVDQAVTYLLKCLAEELWHLPELQPIYTLQFQRMTAEATRQQVELQKAQLQALTELNSGVRESLVRLTDALLEERSGQRAALPQPGLQNALEQSRRALAVLEEQAAGYTSLTMPAHLQLELEDKRQEVAGLEQRLLFSDESERRKVYHNLPQPDYGRFVGRKEEIKQIYSILRPYPHSQSHLVTIDGIGGIGKSSLALEMAWRYVQNYDRISVEERFDAIIWTSAKRNVLTASGITNRNQAIRSIGDIFTAIAITLQREDIPRSDRSAQTEIVRNVLQRQRTLLIVDNLESVDDEDVVTFLRELPAPTKAIVTTRHRIDVAYAVRLTAMPWTDAERLIGQECAKKNVKLTEQEKNDLYHCAGGLPLAIVWSIAQTSQGYLPTTVLNRLSKPAEDIARFCFEEGIQHINGKPALELLFALSLFATDATRDALGFVANLSEWDRDQGLAQLEQLSFINRFANRFSMLPLTKEFIRAFISEHGIQMDTPRSRWFSFYQDQGVRWATDLWLSRNFRGGTQMWAAKAPPYLADITENPREPDLSISVRDLSTSFLQELTNYQDTLDWCLLNERRKDYIEMVLAISWPLWVVGIWSDWRAYVQRGFEIALQMNDEYAIARFNETFGTQAFFMQNYIEAISNLTSAVNVYQKLRYEIRCISTFTFLGQSYTSIGEYQKAEDAFHQALSQAIAVTEIDKDARLISRVRRHYAELLISQKRYAEAETALREVQRTIEEQRGNDGLGMSLTLRILAHLYNERGEYQNAIEYGEKALLIAERLGLKFDAAVTKKILISTYFGLGHTELANKLAEETKELFKSIGLLKSAQEIECVIRDYTI